MKDRLDCGAGPARMPSIRDTMTGKQKSLGSSGKVGVYLCGVTVYDESHVGHARTVIMFDVLRRHLESRRCKVKMVQNFTDVDDKIIERAAREGTSATELGERHIRDYHECFDALNVKRASEYPRATEHIPDMIKLIGELLKSGAAYTTGNGVYFSVSKFSRYGMLSGKDTSSLRAGSRVAVDEDKADPLDFALWKRADSEPSWDSPWGRGRPGWHIECSAMSLRYLGESFDVHGGGRDLIFPHHENEIAQSQAHTGVQPAGVWMHVGMVTVNGEKMSKSIGNIKPVRQLLRQWGPNVIRLFCIGGHYSKPIDYTEDMLREHRNNWERVRHAYHVVQQRGDGTNPAQKSDATCDVTAELAELRAAFEGALDDDLNTHMALEAFYRLVSLCLKLAGVMSPQVALEIQPVLIYMMKVLGLYIKHTIPRERNHIGDLIRRRNELRAGGEYAEADRIRDELQSMGIELIDEKTGTIWARSEHSGLDEQTAG